MAAPPSSAADPAHAPPEKRPISVFDLPENFFDACHLVHPSATSVPVDDASETFESRDSETLEQVGDEDEKSSASVAAALDRWTCNTCKAEFESLQDQRSHFKLDVHRFNVKLSIAGKDAVKEEDFDELTADSFKDFDVSSISGSEDEDDKGSVILNRGLGESFKQKLFVRLQKGEKVSLWRSLLLDDSQSIFYESDKTFGTDNSGFIPGVRENLVVEKIKSLTHEPRDGTHLRIVLLASAGHFAGCVFDGNLIVAHKTFHRYVVRARAGKKQSSKDGAGRSIHSAGASLRRYNELALKKDVQELLGAWKTYFDAASCVFIHAPSSNRQLLFNGEKPYFSNQHCVIRKVPLIVRRPTLKEARRIYNQLTQVSYEVDEKEKMPVITKDSMPGCNMSNDNPSSAKEISGDKLAGIESTNSRSSYKKAEEPVSLSETENESGVILTSTPLHEAAHIGDVGKVLELLEQGLDPCIIDERGRTPYIVASDKEVRNTFRRFMAENLDKWDWHAAKVPSPLTKEMEESQSARQAEKDAKKKARAKELKKLRKAKEKKAQAEATSSKNASGVENREATKSGGSSISKEEEMKAEREKRAAAAERRMAAALAANPNSHANALPAATDVVCSCCNLSLAGKVPFHRYSYQYCSSSCMHVHKQILEDG